MSEIHLDPSPTPEAEEKLFLSQDEERKRLENVRLHDENKIRLEYVRSARGLATAVGIADTSGHIKPAYCASACVLVFAGGKPRYGVLGSALGVHRFTTTKPIGDPVAEIVPPTPGRPPKSWLGAMAGSARIAADIVSPAGGEQDWDVFRR